MAWIERYLDLSIGSGGSGTVGDPWGSYAAAVTGIGTPSAPTMVRVRGSGTLSAGLLINPAGTAANPIWWRGCDPAFVGIGDTDTATARPSLACGANQVTVSGAFNILSHLGFSGSHSANGNGQVFASGVNCVYHRIRVENTAATANGRAMHIYGTDSRAFGCRIKANPAAQYALSLSGARSGCHGGAIRGGTTGITMAGGGNVTATTIRGSAADGVEVTAGLGSLLDAVSVAGVGRDGIRIALASPSTITKNCLVSGAGGYGYNYLGRANITLFVANGWFNCARGGFATGVTEDFRLLDVGDAGLLAGDPFADEAAGDLTPTVHARSFGFPGSFEGETFVGHPDLGAVQAVRGGGGTPTYAATSDVRLGVDRGDGTPGTLVIPEAADVFNGATFDNGTVGLLVVPVADQVLVGAIYGQGGAASEGTVVLPGPGDVLDGVQYGAGGVGFAGTLAVTSDEAIAAIQSGVGMLVSRVTATRMAKLDVAGTLANTDNADTFRGGGASAAEVNALIRATPIAADVVKVNGQDATLGAELTVDQIGDGVAAKVLLTPGNKLAVDSTGRVTVGSNVDKTGYSAAATNLPVKYPATLAVADVEGPIPADVTKINGKDATPDGELSADVVSLKADVAAIKGKIANLPADPASATQVNQVIDGIAAISVSGGSESSLAQLRCEVVAVLSDKALRDQEFQVKLEQVFTEKTMTDAKLAERLAQALVVIKPGGINAA